MDSFALVCLEHGVVKDLRNGPVIQICASLLSHFKVWLFPCFQTFANDQFLFHKSKEIQGCKIVVTLKSARLKVSISGTVPRFTL